MATHAFIFSPGTWYGEGKILLNMVEEELIFQTSWAVQPSDFSGKVRCAQQVTIQGLSEQMRNDLNFFDFQGGSFVVEMENPNVGRITGAGLCDDKMIAWEFRSAEMQFEGFETYTLQSDGSYQMRGEYVTTDQFRTLIEARIWLQSQEVPEIEDSQENEE